MCTSPRLNRRSLLRYAWFLSLVRHLADSLYSVCWRHCLPNPGCVAPSSIKTSITKAVADNYPGAQTIFDSFDTQSYLDPWCLLIWRLSSLIPNLRLSDRRSPTIVSTFDQYIQFVRSRRPTMILRPRAIGDFSKDASNMMVWYFWGSS